MSKARIARTRPPRPVRRGGGASRLEIMVVTVLISIVAALLLERLTRYQEYAEKAVMEATIAHMRSGLRVRVAELMINDQMASIDTLLQENPITWLNAPPANYLGVLDASGTTKPASGNWYFDASVQQLVYLPYHQRFFRPENDGTVAEVRLQVFAIRKPDSVMGTENARVQGLSLNSIRPYYWK